MTPIEGLVDLLATTAHTLGMGHHSYIVGGAPRDFALGQKVKDVDVVVEKLGDHDAARLAYAVARRIGLESHPDHYGVCHIGPVMDTLFYNGVDLRGQKVEIVTARREKYDRTRGKDSHKPVEVRPGTILEDLTRRDFTINTLMWRLESLTEGMAKAPILDFLGRGMRDLQDRTLFTPLDPVETFDDDPTRMLRAVRFAVKFDLTIDPDVYKAIHSKAYELRRVPYEAIDPLFFDKILKMEPEKVQAALTLMERLNLISPVIDLIPESRMRRAIQERIRKPQTLMLLASHGFATGVAWTPPQLATLSVRRLEMSETEFEDLFRRFKKPLDVESYVSRTGAKGPAIGKAVETARDMVLAGLSPDQILQGLAERPNERTPI